MRDRSSRVTGSSEGALQSRCQTIFPESLFRFSFNRAGSGKSCQLQEVWGMNFRYPKKGREQNVMCAAFLFEGEAILISLLTGHSLENIRIER
ncbi:hypothetical protein SAMN05216412_10780 [Nitrosospira multiformis]|uniref:Uncharacterized protein n=1 Tax=Nitrosospira multiformis TaxID=1231 RepID=A0A1I0ETD3_9PROT|nr:hypothetical protein SAMN05216412_10780 [Nitrosospira multiformis]